MSNTPNTNIPSKMPFQLQDLDHEKDWPNLMECIFLAHENPSQKFFPLFYPTHGTRSDALLSAAERTKKDCINDPTSYVQKVVDEDSGKIVGGALWNIYMENPFSEGRAEEEIEVTWYPNDSSREYAAYAVNRFGRPHERMARRPHLCM